MSDNFHRWTAPAYTGAPSIPNPGPTPVNFNGVNYSYINVTPGGDGGGDGSSPADAAKSGGPNAGTFWVAFGEDSTSLDVNRGMRALAENTDTLDDRFHVDISVSVLPPYVTAVAPTNPITAAGPGVFVGTTIGYPLAMLFEVVDDLNREIFDPTTGEKIEVTSISGAAIGDGFSTGDVTLTLNHAIQTGQTYSVWYGLRSNLASLPTDALNFHRIRSDNEVDAEVENVFRNIQGPAAQDIDWNQVPPTTTLFDAASRGLNDLYNRANVTTVPIVPPESYWSTNVITGEYFPAGVPTTLSAPGGGGWFDRTGPAVTGYADNGGVYTDPLQALFAAKVLDTAAYQSSNPGAGGASGFVFHGARRTGTSYTGESLRTPGFAGFLHTWPHDEQSTLSTSDPFTRIVDGAAASLIQIGAFNKDSGESIVEVTQPNCYFRNGSGYTSVSPGYDLLEVTYTVSGVTYHKTFVIVGLGTSAVPTDPVKVRVRNVDGTCPDFSASPTGTIRWVSTTFASGDGAGAYHWLLYTDTLPVLLDGLFYQVPPFLSSTFTPDNVPRTPPSFSAQGPEAIFPALRWGGFQYGVIVPGLYGPMFPSFLGGDGGFTIGDGVVTFFNAAHIDIACDVTFANTLGPFPTFTIGAHAAGSSMILFGDSSTSSKFTADAASVMQINGAFNFNGMGTTNGTNNDATFGAGSILYLNGYTRFGNGGATTVIVYPDAAWTWDAGAALTFDNNPLFNGTTTFDGSTTFNASMNSTVAATFSAAGILIPAITVGLGALTFTGTLPGPTDVSAANSLYGDRIITAHATGITNGIGGFSTQYTANCQLSISGDQIDVSFNTQMVDSNYTLTFGSYIDYGGTQCYWPQVVIGSKDLSGFSFKINSFNNIGIAWPGGSNPFGLIGLDVTAGIPFDFTVVGRQ